MEISVFLNLFDNHNLSVGRCYYHLVGVALEISFWAAEKVQHYGIDDSEDADEAPESRFAVYIEPEYCSDGDDENRPVEQCVCSFSMYSYVLQFFYFLTHSISS